MKSPFSLREAQRKQDLSRLTQLEVLPIACLSFLLWPWASIAGASVPRLVNKAAFSLQGKHRGAGVE